MEAMAPTTQKTKPRAKTITTNHGTRIRISKASHIIVRRVYRSGLTVSITDGRTTHDVQTFTDEPQAFIHACRLAEAAGLIAPETIAVPLAQTVDERDSSQPELPFG